MVSAKEETEDREGPEVRPVRAGAASGAGTCSHPGPSVPRRANRKVGTLPAGSGGWGAEEQRGP